MTPAFKLKSGMFLTWTYKSWADYTHIQEEDMDKQICSAHFL